MIRHEFVRDGVSFATDAVVDENSFLVSVDGIEFRFVLRGTGRYRLSVDGHRIAIAAVRVRDRYLVDINGHQLEFRDPSSDTIAAAGGSAGAGDQIFAPMPGKVVKLLVSEGDDVEVGQPLIIVEAMKMENQVRAGAAGRVASITVAAGDQVDTESPLIRLDLVPESDQN